jgi:hypothetical protein
MVVSALFILHLLSIMKFSCITVWKVYRPAKPHPYSLQITGSACWTWCPRESTSS